MKYSPDLSVTAAATKDRCNKILDRYLIRNNA